MKFICLLCLCVCLVCLAFGCVKSPEPPPVPAAKSQFPASWDDQRDRDWMYRHQYKTHMRGLWIASNRIVSAGRGDAMPTWVEIRSAAMDIKQRADMLGGHWRELERRATELIECVEDDDRVGAHLQYEALGVACDACHLATWSPAYLHVTNRIADGWLANKVILGSDHQVDAEPPPETPNRRVMNRLFMDWENIGLFMGKWMAPDTIEAAEAMRAEFKKRADRWQRVSEFAGQILKLAEERKRDGLKDAYASMTNTCLECHAENVGDDRQILMPMSWDGPIERIQPTGP